MNENIFDINTYDFPLDESLIAQTPAQKRDHSRLMILNKDSGEVSHHHFFDIVNYLHEGDVLVRNNSKVIPARLIGVKEVTGAKVELLLLKDKGDNVWECLAGNAKVLKVGVIVSFGEGLLKAEILEVKDEGIRIVKLIYNGILMEILDELGKMPLPPYIHEQCEDKSRYQNVYAKNPGSSAAPTAGFHFTDELFEKLKAKGVIVVDVTLHIGLGTFRPVKVNNILEHNMHTEYYEMDAKTADILNKAKAEKRRIIAIGTTSVRTLESIMNKYNKFVECKDNTNIFIYPGYEFKAIDCLITNFHLPKSTLIMLVSAFAGKEKVMNAYRIATEEKYRFFSFGDSMFIYGK